MRNFRLKIFCELTTALKDNNAYLNYLLHLADNKEMFNETVKKYESGSLSTRDFYAALYELTGNLSLNTFDNAEETAELSGTFIKFVRYCTDNDFEIIIFSDCIDSYTDPIFKKENPSLKRFAGILKKDPVSDKFEIFYPYTDEYCRLCNTCKRNILVSHTNDLENEISVLIGDSISDRCVSGFADIVFAKGKLASYCWKNNITYFEFNDFEDIINKISKPENKKFLKQKNEARVRRKDLFLGG
ncbi:MAG: hypothetical protein IPM38_17095 [Ignavibacteria bacterium]|nr:hypothetical protein [Ignavibacteria bacterium]